MKLFGSGGDKKPKNAGQPSAYDSWEPKRDGRQHAPEPPDDEYYEEDYYDDGDYDYDDGHDDGYDEDVEGLVRDYKRKKRRRRSIAGIVVLAIIIGVVIAYPLIVRPPEQDDGGLHNPNVDVSPTIALPETSDAPQVEQPPPTEEQNPYRKPGTYTFLAVGNDDGQGNTDTMIVGMLDTVNRTLSAVSIPRDTLVNVPWAIKKVNSIYSYNSPEDATDEEKMAGLLSGVRDLLGYTPDFYVSVDLEAFKKLVDAMGGVYFNVPIDMITQDYSSHIPIYVPAGYFLLDGIMALGVIRFREAYPDGDLGRIKTQQAFFMATAKQLLQIQNITKVNEFAKIFEEHVDTSLKLNEILWLAQEFMKLSEDDISFMKMPGNEGPFVPAGVIPGGSFVAFASYVSTDVEAWVEMLNEHLNPWKQEITTDNLNILTYDTVTGTFHSTSGNFAK